MGGRRGGTREEGAPGTGETGVGGELGEWRRRDAPWERRLERGYQGFGEEALGKAEGPRRWELVPALSTRPGGEPAPPEAP